MINVPAKALMLSGLFLFLQACSEGGDTVNTKAPGDTPVSNSDEDQIVVLDSFDTDFNWRAESSEREGGVPVDVSVTQDQEMGLSGSALRLDFDFKGANGYVVATRDLSLDLPEDFAFSMQIKGDGMVNQFEIKFLDATGRNVWMKKFNKFEFKSDWQKLTISKRQIDFSWGTIEDKVLRKVASIELVVVSRQQSSDGVVYIDDLTFQARQPQPESWGVPALTASSEMVKATAKNAFDGDRQTAWHTAPGGAQSLTLDFARIRELGAIGLYWEQGQHPEEYDIAFSDDGKDWQLMQTVQSQGGREILYFKDAQTRFLKVLLRGAVTQSYALQEMEIKPAHFGDSLNDYIEGLASEVPPGSYPRSLSGEQGYWTIVGSDGGQDNALLSEDGALEIGRGQFSLEPFIVSNGKVNTWADVEISHSLEDDYLPIPSVHWKHSDWDLTVTALAPGAATEPGDGEISELLTRYRIKNTSNEPQEITLAIAARPFQVNSPKQILNTLGGVSKIENLVWDGNILSVNQSNWVQPLSKPAKVSMSTVSTGAATERLHSNSSIQRNEIHDALGLASATLHYPLSLASGDATTLLIKTPLIAAQLPSLVSGSFNSKQSTSLFDNHLAKVRGYWQERLNRIELIMPTQGQRIFDTLRSSLAHILISRNGFNLRPGTRNYGHSWIRDGAMISEGLLRLGIKDIPVQYVQWFAPFQFENGKVPCCVTQYNKADPVPENDSHGQLIFLIAEIYRYTGDRQLVEKLWPHIEGSITYMDQMRRNEQRAENQSGARKVMYGLLEPSISHEGYPLPAYSNWDNFWGLKGYNDAVELAQALGRKEAAAWFAKSRDEFRRDLFNSLRASAAQHGVNYLVGAAELGDFDSTSTTIALAPGGEKKNLPQDLLLATFERYWSEFTARREGTRQWEIYTPYELRQVSTFVRLGWRDRAHQLLDFFFADRRPEAWNQWAEVVGRDQRVPRFIGDMPHAWISSDYIRSVLDLFVYQRFSDASMVLAAGIPADWIDSHGIAAKRLQTAYGELSFQIKTEGKSLLIDINLQSDSSDPLPPGGLIVAWPLGDAVAKSTTINGKTASWKNAELKVTEAVSQIVAEL